METTLQRWTAFCLELALKDKKHTVLIRKIIPDVMFKAGEIDSSISLANLGYSASGTKLSVLKRYYYNQESIDKALKALKIIQKQKKYGSVAFSTIGLEKKFTHHMHCIQSIAIRHLPDGELQYTVFYRAAEVVKIFTGDMVFVRDVIMPIFGKGKVTFFFSNATLNSMHIATLFVHGMKEWKSGIDEMKKIDPAFHRRVGNWTRRYFGDAPINYKSAKRVQTYLRSKLGPKERKEILRKFG